MIIEIRKAGFINKGAELMLLAIMQQVKSRYPEAKLVMAPSHKESSQPFHKLAPLGFYPKASLWYFGVQWGWVARLLPAKIREMFGMVLDREVDVVLDAAGFSYSDQWGVKTSKELASSSRMWKKSNSTVILLPQAFGPFESHNIGKYVKRWVDNSDLIFAREEDSYRYLTSVVGTSDKIKISGDFTNLIAGEVPGYFSDAAEKVAIIPNYRMIDKTGKDESSAYLPFLITCAKFLLNSRLTPFILVHEGVKDKLLAKQISDAVGGVEIISESDPIKIKGIIGRCEATVGSRFHGLVSALSQGVPSLATGWSHKYIRLFQEYGFEDGVISVTASNEEIERKLALIVDADRSREIKKGLIEKSEELKMKSSEMWEMVFGKIEERTGVISERNSHL